MFDHLKEIWESSIETEKASLKVTDFFIDPKTWKLKFFQSNDGALIPSSFLIPHRKKLKSILSAQQFSKLKKWDSSLKLNQTFEEKYFSDLGIKFSNPHDDDHPPLNYTSMIQSTDAGHHFSTDDFQSARSFTNYEITTSTGVLGKVVDLIVNLSNQSLRYFLAEDHLQKNRFLLIDPEWIEEFKPTEKSFFVGLSREILLLEASFDPKREGGKRYEIDV